MKVRVPSPDKQYKVLIRCATYNQSKYICDALNGFAIQETKFPFICIVVDDASKDGNQEVIKQYANDNCDMSKAEISEDDISKYIRIPHKTNENCFFLFCLLKVNLYRKPEKQEIYKQYRDICKYEAICEGDDYWIDSQKIQKQFNYMESHVNCGLIYSKSKILEQNTGRFIGQVGMPYINRNQLLVENPIATLSVLYKKKLECDYFDHIDPNIRASWKMGDYPFWLFISETHDIYFMDEITSVYRANQGSVSRPLDINKKLEFLNSMLDVQLFFAKRLNADERLIDKIYSAHEKKSILSCVRMGEKKKALELLKKSDVSILFKIKTLIRLFINK